MQPSKYQKEIYRVFNTTNQNIIIKASPGSGKTHVLRELAKQAPAYKKVAFFAFNKTIADELNDKTPTHVRCSTIHSLGARILFHHKNVQVRDTRIWGYIKQKYNSKNKLVKATIKELVDLYRLYLCKSITELEDLASHRGVSIQNGELNYAMNIIDIMEEENERCIRPTNGIPKMYIDFVDMLYLPVKYDIPPIEMYDIVFVDEGQDMNPAQIALLDKVIKKRFIVVGDDKQAVYYFQGATSTLFDKLAERPNTVSLPLSITYRCAKSIVKEAQKIFPKGIEPKEDAPDGEVRRGDVMEAKEGDMVLCRNNKPLIEVWVKMFEKGMNAHIYGKSLADQLNKIIDKVDGLSWIKANDVFQDKIAKDMEELSKRGVESPELHPKIQRYLENIEIIGILYAKFSSFAAIRAQMEKIFNDKRDGITLITIHRSKGLESKRVFFHQKHLLPSKYAKGKEELYAEKCLEFVAVTRAKTELIYC